MPPSVPVPPYDLSLGCGYCAAPSLSSRMGDAGVATVAFRVRARPYSVQVFLLRFFPRKLVLHFACGRARLRSRLLAKFCPSDVGIALPRPRPHGWAMRGWRRLHFACGRARLRPRLLGKICPSDVGIALPRPRPHGWATLGWRRSAFACGRARPACLLGFHCPAGRSWRT